MSPPQRSNQEARSSLDTEDLHVGHASEPTQRGDWTLTVVAARSPKLTGSQWVVNLIGIEVGRQPRGVRSPLAIDDPTLSRSHALLEPLGPGRGIRLQDCGSRNGSFINGISVQVGEISDRSVLRLGQVLTVLSCGQPPSDWLGVRADLPALADALVPRPDRKRWVDELDILATEHLLLHRWLGAEDEVKTVFQELLHYAALSERSVMTLLKSRPSANLNAPHWGLRRPTPEELQRLLMLYDNRVADVAAHLNVNRRQVYRWIDYGKRAGGELEGQFAMVADEPDGDE